MVNGTVKLVECPRDAMQGWKRMLPADQKLEYLESLLKVGFDTLDYGSFVSAKAIPQMADTAAITEKLKNPGSTKLLAIVANERGAEEALRFSDIRYLGFPFSVSETFQQRNTNAGIAESIKRVSAIQEQCIKNQRDLVVYISMGFGNPYGDPYDAQIVFEWVNKLVEMGIRIVSLADTVGVATAEQVNLITGYLVDSLPGTEIGVHLHSTAANWREKLDAAFKAGCRRFDGALKGIGGCPMAKDELVGNMNMEWMIDYFREQQVLPALDMDALSKSIELAETLFSDH